MTETTNKKIEAMEDFIVALNNASDAYYGGKEELMSNYEWDEMFDKLKTLEGETGVVLENSPTHKTGASVEGMDEVHEFPALSLAKTKSTAEVQKWAEDKAVHISTKNDGATLVLHYHDDKLQKIVTRGDGVTGKNVSHLQDVISGVPKTIKYGKGKKLVIRGEVMISYKDFEEINQELPDGEQYSNPRNLAAGSLAIDSKNIEKAKNRKMHFQAFTLVHLSDDIPMWSQRMLLLEKLGFDVVEYQTANTPDEIPTVIANLTERAEKGLLPYPADGLVAVYEDTEYAATGSITGHHATRAGLAFKWADESVTTGLESIEWSCAASSITPVAILNPPVEIEGTIVKRASLCNVSELRRLGIGANGSTEVDVIKANKIIPKIISVKKASGTFDIPSKCPVCGCATELFISASGCETLRCANDECSAKHLRLFEKFVGKSGMDIDGLSVQTLRTFISKGYLHSFADIYDIGRYYNEIIELDGFGKKSMDNLLASIEKSRNVLDKNFIYSLNIPMIGHDASKRIIDAMTVEEFLEKMKDGIDFSYLDGFGGEKAGNIKDWYAKPKNQQLLENLLDAVVFKHTEKAVGGSCTGKTFVITGKTEKFLKRDDFIACVNKLGGKVSGSVSKNTDYLVNNDVTSTTGKNKKAIELGVKIISEDSFLRMFM